MNREPMWYAAGGVVFGFVVGYMAAGSGGPRPVAAPPSFAGAGSQGAPAGFGGAPAASGPGGGMPAAAAPRPLDPNEVRALEALAQRDPANVNARIELGNLLMDHEQWDGAVRWYLEALKLDPRNADVRTDMGACLVHAGRPSDAVPVFDEALKHQPGHKKALFNKGIALMQAGNSKAAVAVWEDLLKRYPDDPQLQPIREQIARAREASGS